jgi:hypothetical protein
MSANCGQSWVFAGLDDWENLSFENTSVLTNPCGER